MVKIAKQALSILMGVVFLISSCQEKEILSPEIEIVESYTELIPDQYIVVFKEDKVENARIKFPNNYLLSQQLIKEETQKLLTRSVVFSGEIINVYSQTILGATIKLSEADVEKLRQDERIAYIEQDRIVALAPPSKGGGGSTPQEVPWGIKRVNGGVNYTGTGVAWVLDTGIDLDHPDLNVDASRGFNAFTSGANGKSLDDGNGHGSHVAGTIAAINNTVGVIGVAAGATVIPVKVLDSRGSGSYSGVIAGVDHVGANGKKGDVANMSLSGPGSDALDAAVLIAAEKGIIFCLAAGNSSANANNYSPARVNGTNVYTISAHDVNDVYASFSNFGNPPIDFCAPGVSIKSTWKDGGYNTISGTSMASPHAAGVLLLGAASTGGTVKNDPDGKADPIIVH